MKTRPLSTLEKLAVEAAISAPMKQPKYSIDAYVPWAIINEMRAELDRLGINWEDVRSRLLEIRKERQAAR